MAWHSRPASTLDHQLVAAVLIAVVLPYNLSSSSSSSSSSSGGGGGGGGGCPTTDLEPFCGPARRASVGNCLVCVSSHPQFSGCESSVVDAFCSGSGVAANLQTSNWGEWLNGERPCLSLRSLCRILPKDCCLCVRTLWCCRWDSV